MDSRKDQAVIKILMTPEIYITASKFRDCSQSARESHFFQAPGVWELWQRIFHPDMMYL